MREIKFRCYDPKTKLMSKMNFNRQDNPHISRLNVAFFSDCISNELPIMQFTGLTDRNGKDIYDGDILCQYPGFGCEWKKRTGTVSYNSASFWFDVKGMSFILDDYDCSFEVIGNIYENPELIIREQK